MVLETMMVSHWVSSRVENSEHSMALEIQMELLMDLGIQTVAATDRQIQRVSETDRWT